MYDDVVAIASDVHRTEEIRAVKQQGMGQACYCPSGHLKSCHRCSVVSPLHWNLHNSQILAFCEASQESERYHCA